MNLRVFTLKELGRLWDTTGDIKFAKEIADRIARGQIRHDIQRGFPTLSPQEIRDYASTRD